MQMVGKRFDYYYTDLTKESVYFWVLKARTFVRVRTNRTNVRSAVYRKRRKN